MMAVVKLLVGWPVVIPPCSKSDYGFNCGHLAGEC
jgi:hypothetical protein